MKRFHRLAYGGAALVVAAAVLSVHLVAASGNTARSGRVHVVRGTVPPAGLEVRADRLVRPGRRTQTLGAPASGGLVGTALPVAALSPDGTALAYETFAWKRPIDWSKSFADLGIETGDPLAVPAIRLRDLATGRETSLGEGSASIAWRADGTLAYVVGEPPRYRANLPFLATVVVRTPAGATTTWTPQPERYEVAGWARRTLIVEQHFPGAAPDLLAFDGPDDSRTLARDMSFIGVSPEGDRVLVVDTGDNPHARVRLIRVADGVEIASMPVADIRDPVTQDPVAWIVGYGDWRGDAVVVASETGLVVLRVRDDVAVEQVLHLDVATRPNSSLVEPRFADDRTITAWGGFPIERSHVQAVQYACDRYSLSCTRSAPVSPREAPRPVFDSSGGSS